MTLSRDIILEGEPIELLGPYPQSIGEPRWRSSPGSLKEVVVSNNYSYFRKNVVEISWFLFRLVEEICMYSPKDE